jgi:hypothetical protein
MSGNKPGLICNLFIPKSEIETGNLTQSPGHKRIEKISTDRFGYASIFSIRFCSNLLRHLAGLNFGFRVYGNKVTARS